MNTALKRVILKNVAGFNRFGCNVLAVEPATNWFRDHGHSLI